MSLMSLEPRTTINGILYICFGMYIGVKFKATFCAVLRLFCQKQQQQ